MALQRAATKFQVSIDGQPNADLQVLSVDQSMGGGLADNALVQFDLGVTQRDKGNSRGEHLTNMALADADVAPGKLAGKTCEITRVVGGTTQVVHFGRLNLANADVNQQTERLTLLSRLDRQMFGLPLTFQRVAHIARNVITYIDDEICFNPGLDGLMLGNKRTESSNTWGRPLFIHPESIRTFRAASYQRADSNQWDPNSTEVQEIPATAWDLRSAVRYLCVECNPDETYVKNPQDGDLSLLPDSRSLIRNLSIPPGTFLPQALDMLLTPFAFTWRVYYAGPGDRRIRIEQMGKSRDSQPQVVQLQSPAEKLNPALTDAATIDVDSDTGTLVNQVEIFGQLTQIEATFELVPAWKEEHDGINYKYCAKNDQNPNWVNNPQYHRVNRDWVLNEAGDYIGFRQGIDAPFDMTTLFKTIFGDFHPSVAERRRRFFPTLTTKRAATETLITGDNLPIGEHGGCTVEWYDPKNYKWKLVPAGDPAWSVKILQNECGIRFDGELPPGPMYDALQNGTARVRITATVTSDSRVWGYAPKRAASLGVDVCQQVLVMEDSFHARKVCRTGDRASIYAGGEFIALEADGRAAIQELAELLRNSWDMADVNGAVTIEGCDRLQYDLGQTVSHVAGRAIFLGANSDPSSYQFPQIVRRVLLPQEQKTVLYLQTTRHSLATEVARVPVTIAAHRLRRKKMIRGRPSE